MNNTIFGKIYDNRNSDSLSSRLRKKRFALFTSLILFLPTPVKILDIGGKPKFWENIEFNQKELDITLVNIETIEHSHFKCVVGNARNLNCFIDNQFDVVFSNSVIEHVGDYNDQLKMANEVKRLGKFYFLQTPSLYFPIEPHFVFPFFQFLPISFRTYLLMHFDLGWRRKTPDKKKARKSVTSINLLSKKKLKNLFPEGNLYEEKFLGMTKSFVVYGRS